MPTNTFSISFLVLLLCSCSERSEDGSTHLKDELKEVLDLSTLVAEQTGGGQDLAIFLNSGNKVQATNVVEDAKEDKVPQEQFGQNTESSVPTDDKVVADKIAVVPLKTHSVQDVRSKSLGDFQISLQELHSLNARKDQIIASLTRLNDELLQEVKRLRFSTSVVSNESDEIETSDVSNGQLYKLQNEISNLKSNLMEKSKELDGLRLRNDQFINGIDSLQPRVLPENLNNRYLPYEGNRGLKNLEFPNQDKLDSVQARGTCSLEFDAVVTLLNGRNKEVFYTEFFLIPQSFPELLLDQGFFLRDYPQISSFEELWAKSRKSPFSYPGAYKRIRNILLEQVEQGKGYRIRTDIDGFAEFKNLSPSSYYLVGTAPVGKVGAVWNIPIRLKTGYNKTSLTLANTNWRE